MQEKKKEIPGDLSLPLVRDGSSNLARAARLNGGNDIMVENREKGKGGEMGLIARCSGKF